MNEMAITENTVFNRVIIICAEGTPIPSVILYNNNNPVVGLRSNYSLGAYDTSTDEFQIVADAINAETAVEIYTPNFGSSTQYTDETLPSYLAHWKENNPFHQARIVSQSATNEVTPHTLMVYKNLSVIQGAIPPDPIGPANEYNSFTELLAAVELAGWVVHVSDLPDLTTGEARYELRILHYTNADGNFVFEASPLTSGTTRYSTDSENWHLDRTDDDLYFSILDGSGHWQIYSLESESVISQIAGVSTRKVVGGSYYIPSAATPVRINLANFQYAKIERIELLHRIFSNYIGAGGYLQGAGIIEFPVEFIRRGSSLSGMITPTQITRDLSAEGVSSLDQFGLRYFVNKDLGHTRIGVNSTDISWAREDNNVGIIFLETYPKMEMLGFVEAGPNNVTSTMKIDASTGLSIGDTLFWGTEQMQLSSIDLTDQVDPQGDLYDVITVSRNQGGTMQSNAAPYPIISGIVDQSEGDVLRFLTIAQTAENKRPCNFRLRIFVLP